jgi:hypothetical protein
VGVVHSKFQNAKLKIEERMVDVEVKFVLPRVWIQFTGLPSHLRDFLVIWAVGSILGVSKDVGMEFMRHHGISRLQIAVMNPNLIPQKVNIVIGENVCELKFRVERNVQGGPHPMDMDDNQEEDGAGWSDKVGTNPGEKQNDKGRTGASDDTTSGVNLNSGGGLPAGHSLCSPCSCQGVCSWKAMVWVQRQSQRTTAPWCRHLLRPTLALKRSF